jgi:hypothetical protein
MRRTGLWPMIGGGRREAHALARLSNAELKMGCTNEHTSYHSAPAKPLRADLGNGCRQILTRYPALNAWPFASGW